jgi:TolA protein
LVIAVGWSAFHAGPRIDLTQKPIQARLLRKGQLRDPKFLPRVEEPPPPPKAEPVPIPSAVPAAAAPAKAPTKAAKVDESSERRSRLFDAFQKTSDKKKKAEPLEGSPDGDADGDSATGEGEQYYALISSTVKRYYDVSHTISEQDRLSLVANVLIRIGESGAVETAKVAESSGNELFDDAVLSAVKKAAPFPPPPAHLRESLRRPGIVLRFRP